MRRDPFALPGLPPMVQWLLIANGIGFVLQQLSPFLFVHLALWPLGQNVVPTSMGLAQAPPFRLWQLLSYGFLHSGFSHLFFNMFGLWMFGRAVELMFGSRRFLLYYLVCVVGAGICQLLTLYVAGARFATPTIGASGGLFGILLAFGMMFPNARVMLLFPPIPMTAKWLVIGYGLLELYLGMTGAQAGVAHFAHLGGMAFGFALIWYWRNQARPRR